MPLDRDARVTAVLGPTNTGKTHYALERMLGHRTGVIGLPLRLLAREVFDKIVALRGPSVVALVTGEERIVPPRTAYWVCTVEAMPLDLGADFVAVDEIQLCADADRGHIFTDRLLNARGFHETLFLGSDTMRGHIAHLIPGAAFLRRERFSALSYTGPRKLSRMPARSAVVGFSVEDVYAIAELIRRQQGGAAVVMGALSPRTRNAQVALYQNGDVDYLVATDAIGMGLNLDIAHVAFSGTTKFDGRRHRHLAPHELAQIAGRAGRFTAQGTFGVTAEAPPLDPEVVEAIENHRFKPIEKLQWRNARLDFGTLEALIRSLEAPPEEPDLVRAREADDLLTLRMLAERPELRDRVAGARDVRLLWDVCQIPDFRKVSPAEHAGLCARLYEFLHGRGGVPDAWLGRQIERIDRTDGDIDALSKRLAFIRTWTYVAQRSGWTENSEHWRDETRAVEDRLSDALHARLTQRFVDRRTSVLLRRLKQREGLVAHVTENGEVSIDDQFIGRLEGFRFRLDKAADPGEARTLRSAGIAALAPALSLRADKFYNAPDTEMDVTEQGGLMWGEHAVGRLARSDDILSPQVQVFVDEDAAPEIGEKVRRRLGHWIDRRIAALFEPLLALRKDESLSGMARGLAFRLVEALGVLPRSEVAEDVKGLDQEGRASLRKHGVRFGQYTLFLPQMLKPAPTRLRLILWALAEGLDEFPAVPPPGLVTVPVRPGLPQGYWARAGYRLAGERAIRIDMLERLADLLRPLDARAGFEATPDMLSITGLSLEQFAKLMRGMGYHAEEGTRPKQRAADAGAAAEPPPQAAAESGTGRGDAAPEAQSEGADAMAPLLAGETGEAEPDPGPDLGTRDADSPTGGAPANAAAPEPDAADAQAELDASQETEAAGGDAPEAGAAVAKAADPDTAEEAAAPSGDGNADDGGRDAAAADRAAKPAPDAPGEAETFFVFSRQPRQRQRQRPERRSEPKGRGEPAGGKGEEPRGKGKPKRGAKGAPRPGPDRAPKPGPKPERPPRREREKPIDPDSPFAALMALKTRR